LRPQNPRLGVKAEPAIRVGSAGSTAKLGSLSWLVSKLRSRGIIFTTVTCAAFPILVPATTERAPYTTANRQRASFRLPSSPLRSRSHLLQTSNRPSAFVTAQPDSWAGSPETPEP